MMDLSNVPTREQQRCDKPYGHRLVNRKPKYLGWTNWFPFVPVYVITFEGDDLLTVNRVSEDDMLQLVSVMNGAYVMGKYRGYLSTLEDE